jgi:hypothetical protein
LDARTIETALHAALAAAGLEQPIRETHPHLFSSGTVFVSPADLDAMQAVIRAVETVIATPAYQAEVLGQAGATARHDSGAAGAFLGFDFHLAAGGPRLIEINTNAGGALFILALLRAHLACCAPLRRHLPHPGDPDRIEAMLVDMLRHEWRSAGHAGPLTRIAIVDDRPREQFLYPEFVLFEKLFRRYGITACIADPSALTVRAGHLWAGDQPVDLVYNRLTDFALAQPSQAALRQAYLENLAVVTPHPRAHALYADKRNLALLTDRDWLRATGIPGPVADTLLNGVAATRRIDPAHGDALWSERKQLFFKPVAGYGSKAVYRGDKLTRRVWEEILASDYVAQALVPPAEQPAGAGMEPAALKYDVRNFAYRGDVQLLAARLYQGQATNFRTPGGGFAPVFRPEPAP